MDRESRHRGSHDFGYEDDDNERERYPPRRVSPGKTTLTSRVVVYRDAIDAASPEPSAAREALELARTEQGSPLPEALTQSLGQALGVDLSQVRVHRGNAAAMAAEILHANAFTLGADIFFGAGKYDATSAQGRELIAHEVAHTAQQGGVSSGTDSLRVSTPGESHERDAHAFASAFVRGETTQGGQVQSGTVSRDLISRDAKPGGDRDELDAKTKQQLAAALVPLSSLRSSMSAARGTASTAFADAQKSLKAIEGHLSVLNLFFDVAYLQHTIILMLAAAEVKQKEETTKAIFFGILTIAGLVGPTVGALVGEAVVTTFTDAVKITQNIMERSLIKVVPQAKGKEQGKATTDDLVEKKGETAVILAGLDIGRAVADAAKQVVKIGAAADALAGMVEGTGDAYIEIDQYERGIKKDKEGLAKAKQTAAAITSKKPDTKGLQSSAEKASGVAKGLGTMGTKLGAVVTANPPLELEEQLWLRWLAQLKPEKPELTPDEYLFNSRAGAVIMNRRTGTQRSVPKSDSNALNVPVLRSYLENRGIIGPEGKVVFSDKDTPNDLVVAIARVKYFVGKTGEVQSPGVVVVDGLQLFADTGDMKAGTKVKVTDGRVGEDKGFGDGQVMHFTVAPVPEDAQ